MPSITIELPDSAYRAALSFPPAERMRLGTIALSAAFATTEAAYQDEAEDEEPPTTVEHIAAIREAFADEEAGECIDGDVFMAELREKRGREK
ncbi:MAG: hypothetical protein H7145_12305 [Akkermansiaceae bacterium]|nr:hypothetical protein [Armatimonadota bacterium]